jgi:hypothetical protein
MWALRFDDAANVLWQASHTNGFSPVCRRMCRLKADRSANDLPHAAPLSRVVGVAMQIPSAVQASVYVHAFEKLEWRVLGALAAPLVGKIAMGPEEEATSAR